MERHCFFHLTKPIQAWRSVHSSWPPLAAVPGRYSGTQALGVVWGAGYGDCQSLVSTDRHPVFSNLYCLADSIQIKAPIMLRVKCAEHLDRSTERASVSLCICFRSCCCSPAPAELDRYAQGIEIYVETGQRGDESHVEPHHQNLARSHHVLWVIALRSLPAFVPCRLKLQLHTPSKTTKN